MKRHQLLKCITPTAPLRNVPNESGELETQILYGEECKILEYGDDQWIFIESNEDCYQGWSDIKHFKTIENHTIHRVILNELSNCILYNNRTLNVPFGSLLNSNVEHLEQSNKEIKPFFEKTIIEMAMLFLGCPYLWGGKTMFGIDCSGLVQIIFRACGVKIPRNASQQVLCGFKVDFENSEEGDLAFFTAKNEKISHVGLILKERKIIHAHGEVRIDHFTKEGIFNEENQSISHSLRSIRRIKTV